jgi:hypothetical protein
VAVVVRTENRFVTIADPRSDGGDGSRAVTGVLGGTLWSIALDGATRECGRAPSALAGVLEALRALPRLLAEWAAECQREDCEDVPVAGRPVTGTYGVAYLQQEGVVHPASTPAKKGDMSHG